MADHHRRGGDSIAVTRQADAFRSRYGMKEPPFTSKTAPVT